MFIKREKESKKKIYFAVTILGSFFNRVWEGFQNRWNNIHPCSDLKENKSYYIDLNHKNMTFKLV